MFIPLCFLLHKKNSATRIRTWKCWNQNPVPYHLAIALYTIKIFNYRSTRRDSNHDPRLGKAIPTTEPLVHKVCTFKTTHKLSFSISNNSLRSSFRPISNSQLHASLHFHLCPIYLIVSKGSLTLSSMDISS